MDEPTQFELERYAYHDEIMVAIEQRGRWTRAEMARRSRPTFVSLLAAHVWLIGWVVAGKPGGVPIGLGATVALGVVGAAAFVWWIATASPRKLRRRWNADHPQMGQYLASARTE